MISVSAPLARRPLRFALLFLLLFSVMAWPFATIGRAYGPLVCRAINGSILNSVHATRVARLLPNARQGAEWHAVFAVWNQNTKSLESQLDVDIHQFFYLPTAVFIALTLAGAWTWRGQQQIALKLFIGIALFQLRGTLPFVLQERVVSGGIHSGLIDVIFVLVNRTLVGPLGMAYALPLFLWLGLCRKSVFSPSGAGADARGAGCDQHC